LNEKREGGIASRESSSGVQKTEATEKEKKRPLREKDEGKTHLALATPFSQVEKKIGKTVASLLREGGEEVLTEKVNDSPS